MSASLCTRRDFLRAAGFGAAAIAFGGYGPAAKSAASLESLGKPNIVLIMADDMGYSDIGCYGGEIHTPNLDRLAAGGIRFSQFYNGARCCPTRASLLTGLYAHQAGIGFMVGNQGYPAYQGYLNDRCVTIAEALKPAGYHTLMAGKWHVGEDRPHWPTERGFDRYFGLISGAANYFDPSKTKAEGVTRKMALDGQLYEPPKEGFYMTDAFTDHAIEFLDEHGSDEQPFFLYLPYTAPHWPLHAWPEDIAKYKGKYRRDGDQIRAERRARMIEMGLISDKWQMSPRDTQAVGYNKELDSELTDLAMVLFESMDLKMAVYAAQIERMDAGIGRVLEKIEALGQQENTLVMFLADNGGCAEGGPTGFDNRKNGLPPGGVDSYMSYGLSWANVSNTPFRRYKHWVHEGGIATPFIAYWPAVIRNGGTITHEVGHIIDVMATCVDAAGAEYPKTRQGKTVTPLEGKSLIPVFRMGKRTGHDALFWEHEGNRAVRQSPWKLVSAHGKPWELYDLETDRTELHDLADEHPEKVKELEGLYQRWAERCGVRPWPVRKPRN